MVFLSPHEVCAWSFSAPCIFLDLFNAWKMEHINIILIF